MNFIAHFQKVILQRYIKRNVFLQKVKTKTKTKTITGSTGTTSKKPMKVKKTKNNLKRSRNPNRNLSKNLTKNPKVQLEVTKTTNSETPHQKEKKTERNHKVTNAIDGHQLGLVNIITTSRNLLLFQK